MGTYASCMHCLLYYAVLVLGPDLVGGGRGCSGMLLLHPVPNSADAGPDL